jgi:hypothetical protein
VGARDVLKRQLALREAYAREGKIDHCLVFVQQSGAPLVDLSYAYDRWVYVIARDIASPIKLEPLTSAGR